MGTSCRALALRALWAERDLPPACKLLAEKIIRAMGDDGTLPPRITRTVLMHRAGVSHVTFAKHVRTLEARGLIVRSYTGRLVTATGEYRHVLVIELSARFTTLAQRASVFSSRSPKHGSDVRKERNFPPTPPIGGGLVVEVDKKLPVPRAHARDTEPEPPPEPWAQRSALIGAWHTLAESRTDVPLLRPGYQPFDRSSVRCLACRETGHIAAYCPQLAALRAATPDPAF